MTTLTSDPAVIDTLGRATLYALAAHGLAHPTERRREVIEQRLLPAACELDPTGPLADALDRLERSSPVTAAELRPHHLRLFPPIASQDAPGYETAYRGDDLFRQVDLLADIAGFYRAHGFEAGGAEHERPDHIVVELEFMSLVCRKEAHALLHLGPDQVEVCAATRRAFLRDHLGCWAPAFAARVEAVSTHPWYTAVGSLVAAVVTSDLSAEGIEPSERVEQPLPPPPPDEDACGPCGPGATP